MIGVAAVRSAMLTGLGTTALALAGEVPSPLPASSASRAPGLVGEASRVPGTVGEASQAPGLVGEASRAPGAVGEASRAPGTVGEASRAPGTVGEASRAPGAVGEASRAPGVVRRVPESAKGEEADGGRDPFARPMAPGSRPPVETRPSGLSDLAVDEVVLRGVVTTGDGRLAVLEGPDGRTWVARPGERLHDGAVQEVAADEVLFLRDAADPAAERAVRRRLRDGESAR